MKNIFAVLTLFLMFSCSSSSELKNEFPCKDSTTFLNLKKTSDVRNLFAVSLPKNWKVNLYYDNGKTSIYAADTTVSLTKTILFDATLIHSPVFLDTNFTKKITTDNTNMKLVETKTKHINLFNKPSYFSFAKGKKGKFNYHILNTFTKVNSDNFLHVKTEIYGDSLIAERICNAINLIDKIQLK
ncbi:hypothetical protein [Tenacibaculum insulae]|uniref:hypothetical protein n=1 Tax=Tenacibaculum insulae TaxID=2029677 RepID=UPI003AB6CC08